MDFLKTLANDVHVVRGDFDDVGFYFKTWLINYLKQLIRAILEFRLSRAKSSHSWPI